jgi:excisionase family DNA binding protein
MEKNPKTVEQLLQEIYERQSNLETLILSQKPVLNFEQTVTYTGLKASYLYKLTSTGEIPYYKPNGKLIYFSREELDQWLMQNRKATREEIESQASTYTTLKRPVV